MMRLRISNGIISTTQLRAIGEISGEYGKGFADSPRVNKYNCVGSPSTTYLQSGQDSKVTNIAGLAELESFGSPALIVVGGGEACRSGGLGRTYVRRA
jgi:hypothetical protein